MFDELKLEAELAKFFFFWVELKVLLPLNIGKSLFTAINYDFVFKTVIMCLNLDDMCPGS